MHKLLARQLKRYLTDPSALPKDWAALLRAVEEAYEQADADRLLLERSMELTSQELLQRNEELRRDIAQRKKAEEALETSVSILQATLESTADGILVVNRTGQIIRFNQKFVQMWRIPQEIMVSRDDQQALAFVLHQLKTPAEFLGKVTELYAQPEAESHDLLEFKDGRIFERYSQPQRIAGKSVGRVWSFRDITTQKRAEEHLAQQAQELARSNAELEQFAYVASHDLQEPLRMVASYTQLLARRYKGKLDGDADEFIGYAVKGAIRMQELINDLLTYSRVGTRGKPFAPTDCEALLASTLMNLKLTIEERGATITHEPLPTVMADTVQLGQLFQNLLGNAMKFCEPGQAPAIHLRATMQDGMWRFAVQDNGIGISPQHQKRIFVIFQRLHTSEEYPGTGIGLAICKKIVERHGGRIWVESPMGQGSTFYFTLPAGGGHQGT